MPMRTTQPAYRVTRRADHYEVVALPVPYGKRVIFKAVRAPLKDKVALSEITQALVLETRERFQKG